MNWSHVFDGQPKSHGWYPVLLCFDAQEGCFPHAAFFDGEWSTRAVVSYGDLCETEEQAEKLADENDPLY